VQVVGISEAYVVNYLGKWKGGKHGGLWQWALATPRQKANS
jgi:hypothetical protein